MAATALSISGWTQPTLTSFGTRTPKWHALLPVNDTLTFCGRIRRENWDFSYEMPGRPVEICDACAGFIRRRRARGW